MAGLLFRANSVLHYCKDAGPQENKESWERQGRSKGDVLVDAGAVTHPSGHVQVRESESCLLLGAGAFWTTLAVAATLYSGLSTRATYALICPWGTLVSAPA